ncbi:sulfite exporter TauE/SafE family protein [Propionivibrio limicola]|uniref:sulfite exporter TauE/SafE family protein n=1 Tax=Propionivibrio limicola TaxID=167645 RepID=UPI0012921026|nr:sulfite exporter TauE/SafE family protein [Propionivibrio limicola]
MEFDSLGWVVAAFAVLITGISKSGLGGALGGLAVPLMAIWISPRDAAAVMLPVLIVTDWVGIGAWRGKASWADLKMMLPAAIVGIVLGTLAFGVMPDRFVKIAVGLIAVLFALDRLVRRSRGAQSARPPRRLFAWLAGAGSGFTSTLAHAGGPPVMAYLLSRQLPRQNFVATSVYFFTTINLAKLPTYLALGIFTKESLIASAMLLPLVPLGVWLGLRILAKIPERPFYWFATAALGLSGVKLLLDGISVG